MTSKLTLCRLHGPDAGWCALALSRRGALHLRRGRPSLLAGAQRGRAVVPRGASARSLCACCKPARRATCSDAHGGPVAAGRADRCAADLAERLLKQCPAPAAAEFMQRRRGGTRLRAASAVAIGATVRSASPATVVASPARRLGRLSQKRSAAASPRRARLEHRTTARPSCRSPRRRAHRPRARAPTAACRPRKRRSRQ